MEMPYYQLENALPPEKVRFIEVHVEPWPDGRRVRLHAELTPFQKPPNLDFSILDEQNETVATISMIENILAKFVITMHLRGPVTDGTFRLVGQLGYPEMEEVDSVEVVFTLPPEETA